MLRTKKWLCVLLLISIALLCGCSSTADEDLPQEDAAPPLARYSVQQLKKPAPSAICWLCGLFGGSMV